MKSSTHTGHCLICGCGPGTPAGAKTTGTGYRVVSRTEGNLESKHISEPNQFPACLCGAGRIFRHCAALLGFEVRPGMHANTFTSVAPLVQAASLHSWSRCVGRLLRTKTWSPSRKCCRLRAFSRQPPWATHILNASGCKLCHVLEMLTTLAPQICAPQVLEIHLISKFQASAFITTSMSK